MCNCSFLVLSGEFLEGEQEFESVIVLACLCNDREGGWE